MLDLTIAELETLKEMLEPRKEKQEITLLYNKVINAFIKKSRRVKRKIERKLYHERRN